MESALLLEADSVYHRTSGTIFTTTTPPQQQQKQRRRRRQRMASRTSVCLLRRSLVGSLLAPAFNTQRYSAWRLGQVYPRHYPARCYSTEKTPRTRLAPSVERGASKLYKNADQAVADIQSGSTILSSGFGLCGVAGTTTTTTTTTTTQLEVKTSSPS